MDITSHLSQPRPSTSGGHASPRGGLALVEETGGDDVLEPLEGDVDQTQLEPLPSTNAITVYDPETAASSDGSSDEYQLSDDTSDSDSGSESGLREPLPGSLRKQESKADGAKKLKTKKTKKSRSSRDLWTRWPLPTNSLSLPEWTLTDEVGVIVAQILRSLPASSMPGFQPGSDSEEEEDSEEDEGQDGRMERDEDEDDEDDKIEEDHFDEVNCTKRDESEKSLQLSLQQSRASSPTSSIDSTRREAPPFLAPITKEVTSFLAHLFALIATHSPARPASMQNRIEPIGWEGISELLVGSGEGSSFAGPGGVYMNGKADGWTVNEEVARRTLERLQAIYGPSEVHRKGIPLKCVLSIADHLVLARLDAKARAKGQFKQFLDDQEDRWLFEPLVARSSNDGDKVDGERQVARQSELGECESTLVHSIGETDDFTKPEKAKRKRKRISLSQRTASPTIDNLDEDAEQPTKKRRTVAGKVASNSVPILPRVEVLEDESGEDDEMDELADDDEEQYVPIQEKQWNALSSDDEAEVDHFVRTRMSVDGSDEGG